MKYDFPHPREPKEINLAERLSRFGDDVLLIKASNQPGIKTPDCFWRNGYWELKTINKKANSQKNVFRLLKDAASQAPNIIIDCSLTKRSLLQVSRDIIRYINKYCSHRVRKVLVLDSDKYCIIIRNDI